MILIKTLRIFMMKQKCTILYKKKCKQLKSKAGAGEVLKAVVKVDSKSVEKYLMFRNMLGLKWVIKNTL